MLAQLAVTIFAGTAYNFPTVIRFVQTGRPDLEVSARLETRPFQPSPWFAWRIALERSRHEWALELTHNKFFLENPTPEVSHFEMTHGFNLVTVTHAWTGGPIRWRAGAGAALVFPHGNVRGTQLVAEGRGFAGGYVLTGPVVMVAAGRRLRLGGRFFTDLDGRLTLTRAAFPLPDGRGSLVNVAAHLAVGLGAGPARP